MENLIDSQIKAVVSHKPVGRAVARPLAMLVLIYSEGPDQNWGTYS